MTLMARGSMSRCMTSYTLRPTSWKSNFQDKDYLVYGSGSMGWWYGRQWCHMMLGDLVSLPTVCQVGWEWEKEEKIKLLK